MGRWPERTVAERFWSHVEKHDDDNVCWPWLAALSLNGYGLFGVKDKDGQNKILSAHRVAYLLTIGPIDPGKQINHHCDNRRCCNPKHLRPDTQAANAREMVQRGRQRGGRGYPFGPGGVQPEWRPSDPSRWRQPPSQRFWARVARSEDPDACWPWNGRQQGGRGVFDGPGTSSTITAHRFAFQDAVRPLLPRECVRHLCDNVLCCNPRHLHAYTPRPVQENTKKGRPPLSVRFWTKVEIVADPEACWPWRGGVDKRKRGIFYLNDRPKRAHRFPTCAIASRSSAMVKSRRSAPRTCSRSA